MALEREALRCRLRVLCADVVGLEPRRCLVGERGGVVFGCSGIRRSDVRAATSGLSLEYRGGARWRAAHVYELRRLYDARGAKLRCFAPS